ncbi:MAG TPA: SapC family protein [Burkholderiales bacterium]|nr:SapC family protein [Burkholderiales bacterium]
MNLSDNPYGFKRIVPVDKGIRLRLPDPGDAPRFCHTLNAVPISAAEFPVAMRDYPIAFVRRIGDTGFSSVAILGMREGQNLFVMSDGKWDRRAYMPAFVRRYPFCLVGTEEEGGQNAERLVCVDPEAIDEYQGRPMFDETGEPLPHWEVIQRMLHEYEDDLAFSRDMCSHFSALGLLEPFTLRADLVGGFTLAMENLYRVNRQQLAELDLADLRSLLTRGYIDHIYAHLFSQENFQRLLNRRSFFAADPPTDPKQYN